LVLNTVANI